MESLTPVQKTSVTTFSTERLRLILLKRGYAEEIVLGWSREQLMSKYENLLAQGWDPAVVARPVDPKLEKIRLAYEKEMKEMELELEAKKCGQGERKRAERERNGVERERTGGGKRTEGAERERKGAA